MVAIIFCDIIFIIPELIYGVGSDEDDELSVALDEDKLACPAVASSEGWELAELESPSDVDSIELELELDDSLEDIDEDDEECPTVELDELNELDCDEADDCANELDPPKPTSDVGSGGDEDELSALDELKLADCELPACDDELADCSPPACAVAAADEPNTVLNCSSVTHTLPTQSFSVLTSLTVSAPSFPIFQLPNASITRAGVPVAAEAMSKTLMKFCIPSQSAIVTS